MSILVQDFLPWHCLSQLFLLVILCSSKLLISVFTCLSSIRGSSLRYVHPSLRDPTRVVEFSVCSTIYLLNAVAASKLLIGKTKKPNSVHFFFSLFSVFQIGLILFSVLKFTNPILCHLHFIIKPVQRGCFFPLNYNLYIIFFSSIIFKFLFINSVLC